MIELAPERTALTRELRRVLVLADESAAWQIAGLRQLDRIALSLAEYARSARQSISLTIVWSPEVGRADRWVPDSTHLAGVTIEDVDSDEEGFDVALNTRVLLYRNSVAQVASTFSRRSPRDVGCTADWRQCNTEIEAAFARRPARNATEAPWCYVRSHDEIGACERAFLRLAGKSQDGLASRYVNRPISRTISRFLLRLPITPSTWSITIFALPLSASALLLHGTDRAFLGACVIFQLYSIVDGCDGEIARAKFQQTEFGRRLDSLLDLVGNMLLALCLGIGLARQWEHTHLNGWFYVAEGIAAALCIVLSEGIVFARRSRVDSTPISAKWNGALYQRHHEFLERSGILFLGENVAWWLVQLTKRDMAMLAFVMLAAFGWAGAILHLLLLVSGISSVLAGNAFLRQPAPAVAQEAG